MQRGEGKVAVAPGRPEEEIDLGEDAGFFVASDVVPRNEQVDIGGREQRRRVRGGDTKLAALGARDGLRGCQAQQDGADEVQTEDARQGVDEVGCGVLRGAKRAVGEDGRPILVVEQFGGFALKLVLEEAGVTRGERADAGEAGRDEIAGRGGVGARNGEEVLGAEDGHGGEGQEEGREDEDENREAGPGRQGDYGFALLGDSGVAPGGLVEANRFGEEHRTEEDEEGLDTVMLC